MNDSNEAGGKGATNSSRKRICGGRNKRCRKCQHKYIGRAETCECGRRFAVTAIKCSECGNPRDLGEYELWDCPDCGEPRACGTDELFPNGRCRLHGGKTPAGTASKNFKTGEHSIYSQAWDKMGLGDLHERARRADIYNAKKAMESLQTRILFLLEQGQGVEFFRDLAKYWEELKEANRLQDLDRQRVAFTVLDTLIREGVSEAGRWQEIPKLEEQLDRMRHRDHQRRVDAKLLVSLDFAEARATAFMYVAKTILNKYCKESGFAGVAEQIIADIGIEFARYIGRGVDQRLVRGLGPKADAIDIPAGGGVD